MITQTQLGVGWNNDETKWLATPRLHHGQDDIKKIFWRLQWLLVCKCFKEMEKHPQFPQCSAEERAAYILETRRSFLKCHGTRWNESQKMQFNKWRGINKFNIGKRNKYIRAVVDENLKGKKGKVVDMMSF